jgi:2-oxoglutarate dehydrogenase E1 component
MRRPFRKPLIVMTPKSLLRHKQAVSTLADMAQNKTFHRLLPESGQLVTDANVKRVVLCSGKVYYDLLEEREKRGIKDVALIRVEQLYPFPGKALKEALARHPKAEVVWCQEEPQNMGAWTYMAPRLEAVLEEIGAAHRRPRYVGRPEAASPATGLLRRHNEEQAKLVDEALSLD